MVFFPNHELELFGYRETSDFDSYYEPKKEYYHIATVECDFQPMSPKDSLKEFGEILEDTYKIYINHDVPVESSMILRIKDEVDTYEIIGTPINNNHLTPVQHKKIIVQKQRKPTRLEESTPLDDGGAQHDNDGG